MLNRKYSREEIRISKRMDFNTVANVTGVAWLENKIYLVPSNSKRLHVFPDWKAIDIDSVDEHNRRIEMETPSDMVASKLSRFNIHQRPGKKMFMEDSNSWKPNKFTWDRRKTDQHVHQFIGGVDRLCTSFL